MDKNRILRGRCSCGECSEYIPGATGLSCAYCDCSPVKHVKLPSKKTPGTILKPKIEVATPMPGTTEPAILILNFPSLPTTEMKPCKLLLKSHRPYSVIFEATQDLKCKGVFKIAYDWKTIFISPSCLVIKGLKKQFAGNGNTELYNFMLKLSKDDLKKVSVFWIDDAEYAHKCKTSYKKCITKLMGSAPEYI